MKNNNSQENQRETQSPEGLDRLIKITKPGFWILLIGLSAFTLLTVIWGLWGTIPQKVNGIGLIKLKSGIFKVNTKYSGSVVDLYHELGDTVKEGTVLLQLTQPELLSSINEVNLQLKGLELQDSVLLNSDSQERVSKANFYKTESEKIEKQLKSIKQKISFKKSNLEKKTELLKQGLVTKIEYELTKEAIEDLKILLNNTNAQQKQLAISMEEWQLSKSMDKDNLASQIKVLKKKIADLNKEYNRQTMIKAPTDGIIVSQMVSYGDIVGASMTLFIIEKLENRKNKNYIVDLYIPFNSNADVKVGQDAQINPFTVDKEKFGQIIGKVIRVNHFSSPTASIMESLENDELVNLLNSQGPKYRITIQLKKDSTTVSKFKWTSKKGPSYTVVSGTLCLGSVSVKEKAPIDFIVPIFKKYWE